VAAPVWEDVARDLTPHRKLTLGGDALDVYAHPETFPPA
jgi:hypothetical protein